MRRALVLLTLTVIAVGLLGGTALAAEVTITDDGFSPSTVQAAVGETITWTNDTDAAVTLSSDEPRWSSGTITAGDTFSLALDEPGTVTYESTEGDRSGEIVVTEESAGGDDDATGDDGDAALPETGTDVASTLALSFVLVIVGGTLLLAVPASPPLR